jgi:hypothetical protein
MISPFFILVSLFFFHSAPAADNAPPWLYDGTISHLGGGAPARCAVRDCTCRVTRGEVPPATQNTEAHSRQQSIYFLENEHRLTNRQKTTVRAFASRFASGDRVDITITGHTDGCGTPEGNRTLSSNRADTVTTEIRRVLPNAEISVRSVIERTSGHSSQARRVDIITHTKSSFTTSIEKVPADAYLIDASGSMWSGWDGWNDVINASLKPGSKIYVSKMAGCSNGMSLNSVEPGGGTEIWYSYWIVLNRIRRGSTLAIISDFNANYPLRGWEAQMIEEKVREKQIRVIAIRP